jgi:hypothetical protein
MAESNIGFDIGENCNIELLNPEPIDLWESDNGEPKIDELIQKKFDSYFLDYSSKLLHINFVEFFGIKYYSKKYDRKLGSDEFRRNKYIEVDDNIKKAKIYPGDNYINYKEDKECKQTLLVECCLLPILFFIFLFLWSNGIIKFIVLIGIYLLDLCFQIWYIKRYHKRFLNYKKLEGENLKKLYEILNARPFIELYYEEEKIITIPVHSYADISGIELNFNTGFLFPKPDNVTLESINLNNFLIIDFPLNNIYFLDSTKQYLMFLMVQFNKYCFYKNNGTFRNILSKMYIKFYLKTQENIIIYKNDPFFHTSFVTKNSCIFIFFMYLFIILQFGIPFIKLIQFFFYKIRHIKKAISTKNNFETYINLDSLFPRIIESDKKIKRNKHDVISDRESVQKELIDDCTKLTEMIKEEIEKIDYSGTRCEVPKAIRDNEARGKLMPFSCSSGYYTLYEFNINSFYECYGKKVKKILGISEGKIFTSSCKKDYEDEDEGDNIRDYNNNNYNNNINRNQGKEDNSIKQVIYKEKTLTLKCNLKKDYAEIFYTINLGTGHKDNGKFVLKRPISGGFEKLEEKFNIEWTKSEIYLPGFKDVIEIFRKKRSIKISSENFEIIKETALNDDLHSGCPGWVNNNDYSQGLVNKYVKKCDRSSVKRFKTNSSYK